MVRRAALLRAEVCIPLGQRQLLADLVSNGLRAGRRSVLRRISRRSSTISDQETPLTRSMSHNGCGKTETEGVSAIFSPARRRALTEPTERSEALGRSGVLFNRAQAKQSIEQITAIPAALAACSAAAHSLRQKSLIFATSLKEGG